MTEIRAASRAVRIKQVIEYMLLTYKRDGTARMTAYRIAKGIGMRPTSPAFRELLKDMIGKGMLEAETEKEKPGRWATVWYDLPEATRDTLEHSKRTIKVKNKGVAVGQMRLF